MNPSLCVWTTLRCSPCAGSSLKRAHNWLLSKCTPLRGVCVSALSEDAPAPSGPHQPQHITLDEPSLTCANILCSSILILPTLFFHHLNIDLVISKCYYVFAKMPYNLYFFENGFDTPPLPPPLWNSVKKNWKSGKEVHPLHVVQMYFASQLAVLLISPTLFFHHLNIDSDIKYDKDNHKSPWQRYHDINFLFIAATSQGGIRKRLWLGVW